MSQQVMGLLKLKIVMHSRKNGKKDDDVSAHVYQNFVVSLQNTCSKSHTKMYGELGQTAWKTGSEASTRETVVGLHGVALHVDGIEHKDAGTTCSTKNKENWLKYLRRRDVYRLHVIKIKYQGY